MRYSWLTVILVSLLLGACGAEDEATAPGRAALADIAGYRDWPLRRTVTASGAGHGGSAKVYANAAVANYLAGLAPGAATAATLRYPEGSLIVKDVYQEDGTLRYVAVMRKLDEAPAGAEVIAGWVWSQRKTPASPDEWRDKAACLDCHTRANEDVFRDGVFVFPACGGDVSCE